MEVRITKHAYERFRERCVSGLPKREMRAAIERMLAESVNLSGAALRRMHRETDKDYWIHEATGVIFVLEVLEDVEQITVLTVLFNRDDPMPVTSMAKKHPKFKQWVWHQKPGRRRPYERTREVPTDE